VLPRTPVENLFNPSATYMLYRVTVTTQRWKQRASRWLARPSSLRTVARREGEVDEHSSPAVSEQAANADALVDT
jgi:hypothetical protein